MVGHDFNKIKNGLEKIICNWRQWIEDRINSKRKSGHTTIITDIPKDPNADLEKLDLSPSNSYVGYIRTIYAIKKNCKRTYTFL